MHVGKCALVVTIGLFLAGCDSKKTEPAPAPSASVTLASATSDAPSAASASASASASSASTTSNAPGDGPTEIACQHILIAYKGAKGAQGSIIRSKADAKKRADEIDAKAKGGEDFSALAQQFSDDLGSRDRQGNLGKFPRSKMVPQFADAAFALAVGQVSDVVETPFGYHIIKRNQ